MSTKSRTGGGKNAFQSPARLGLGGFGGFSTTSSTLSYISEPPDLAAVSDANVVVSLKNLLKKDSTTKAKGLDDLLLYVQAHPHEKGGGVEEPVLDAWVSSICPFTNTGSITDLACTRSNSTGKLPSTTLDESASYHISSSSS